VARLTQCRQCTIVVVVVLGAGSVNLPGPARRWKRRAEAESGEKKKGEQSVAAGMWGLGVSGTKGRWEGCCCWAVCFAGLGCREGCEAGQKAGQVRLCAGHIWPLIFVLQLGLDRVLGLDCGPGHGSELGPGSRA